MTEKNDAGLSKVVCYRNYLIYIIVLKVTGSFRWFRLNKSGRSGRVKLRVIRSGLR